MSEEVKRRTVGVTAALAWLLTVVYLILIGTETVTESWRGLVSLLVGVSVTLTVVRYTMRIGHLVRKAFIAGALTERDEKEQDVQEAAREASGEPREGSSPHKAPPPSAGPLPGQHR